MSYLNDGAESTVSMDRLSGIEPTATTVALHELSRTYNADVSGMNHGGVERSRRELLGSPLLQEVRQAMVPTNSSSREGTTTGTTSSSSPPQTGSEEFNQRTLSVFQKLLYGGHGSSTPTTVSSAPLDTDSEQPTPAALRDYMDYLRQSRR